MQLRVGYLVIDVSSIASALFNVRGKAQGLRVNWVN